jgi:hypothetical protein
MEEFENLFKLIITMLAFTIFLLCVNRLSVGFESFSIWLITIALGSIFVCCTYHRFKHMRTR